MSNNIIIAHCEEKIRDNRGAIINYVLKDTNGATALIAPIQLKEKIFNKEIAVDNLTLTSDGRLIDKKTSNKDNHRVLDPNGVLGVESKEDAARAVQYLGQWLNTAGIKASYGSFEHSQPDIIPGINKIYAVTLPLRVCSLQSTKDNIKIIDITNPNIIEMILDKTNIAIGIKVILKTGNNTNKNEFSLRDYKIFIGETSNENNIVNSKFNIYDNVTRKDLEIWLNSQMDKVELMRYDLSGEKGGLAEANKDSDKKIEKDMHILLDLLVHALKINKDDLSMAYRKGTSIGRAIDAPLRPLSRAIAKQKAKKTTLNPNYNSDVRNRHQSMIEDNEEDTNKAANNIGIN